MHLLEIPEANIKRYLPEDLSECNQEQYINMCALLLKYQSQELTLNDFLVQATYYLLDIKKTNKEYSTNEEDSIYSNVFMLSELVMTFFEEIEEENEDIKLIIKQYYINNPIPSFLNAPKTYYGPSDEFDNMTWGEYLDALDPYEDFNQTGDTNYLYQMLAIFYRPKKSNYAKVKKLFSFDGDVRETYNPHQTKNLIKTFKKQPIGLVYGFYLLFASFQKYIQTAKLFIQGREIDFSILFDDSDSSDTKESEVPGLGMKSLTYTLAESNVYGDLEKLRKTPFWEIYVRLYDIRKRDLDAKANEPKK